MTPCRLGLWRLASTSIVRIESRWLRSSAIAAAIDDAPSRAQHPATATRHDFRPQPSAPSVRSIDGSRPAAPALLPDPSAELRAETYRYKPARQIWSRLHADFARPGPASWRPAAPA